MVWDRSREPSHALGLGLLSFDPCPPDFAFVGYSGKKCHIYDSGMRKEKVIFHACPHFHLNVKIFASSVESKAVAMKRQQRKQTRLIYKMLPKVVVEKMNSGKDIAESFESATLYFSSVVGFKDITKKCSALEVIIELCIVNSAAGLPHTYCTQWLLDGDLRNIPKGTSNRSTKYFPKNA